MNIISNLTQNQKIIAGCGLIIVLFAGFWGFSSTTGSVETIQVQQGEFIVETFVAGEIKAHRSDVISVPGSIRGSLQIVEMVPEGTEVQKGDFLIKFDTAEIENRYIEEEAELATEMNELEELIAQHKSDSVQRAGDLEIQRLTLEQNKIAFELAKFEPKNKQRQMEIDMQKAELALQDKIENDAIQNRETLNRIRRQRDEIERDMRDLADYQAQINRATIYAPQAGLVVYQSRRTGPGTEEKIKVGDAVWRSQRLIELPDLSEMRVLTSINEVDISKIQLGQEAIITLDANTDKSYYGTVSDIAGLARRESSELGNRIKVFDVEIAIKNNDPSLKPGMSATCKIITERLENELFIPTQSVLEEENETFVYVQSGRGYSKTPIVVGEKNATFITVKEGLEPLQFVTLRDPYKALEEIGTEQRQVPTGVAAQAAQQAAREQN